MARCGRKRQLELESEYWRSLGSGIGTVAACQAVGIGRKTGYRWRAEAGGLAPDRVGETGRNGRVTCRCWSGSGSPLCAGSAWECAIADELGRSP
jgi:hypothetical protein